MTFAGPEALKALDEALRDIRREESEIARRLARSAELVAKIRETESELLRQLAAVRLDPETQSELAGRLSRSEQQAREMLARHTEALSAAERELKAQDKAIAALNTERAKLAGEAGRLQAELQALADKVAAEISKDPTYTQKRQAADELADVAQEALNKTTQAEADREQKGRPYRDDPLFMYLWESSYGTRDYRANNLVRWLDGMVAGLVRYPEARPNFAMLNEIPLRLREHAERQQQKADAAAEEVEALERAAIDAAGGAPTRTALEAAEQRMAAIDAEIVALEDARDQTAQTQRELAQGRDPAFAAATAALAEGLGREDIQTLLAEARATRTGADDTIVQQIDDARSRALEEETESREQRTRLQTLAARRRELEDIEFEFKKSGFDNPRSTFGEDRLVGDILNDFLRGGISAADYWGRWRQSQSWSGGGGPWAGGSRPEGTGSSPPGRGFGGTSAGNRNWGRLPGGSGKGFSRPRSGSTGTRKHGGFKTGGGF